MKTLTRLSAAALIAIATPSWADGSYDLFGSHGDKWGEIYFDKTVGKDAVWVWPNKQGDTTFYIDNPQAGNGDWSNGTYEGYYAINMPPEMTNPCPYPAGDAYGNPIEEWGRARMEWTDNETFRLTSFVCDTRDVYLEVDARFAEPPEELVPNTASLSLQSDILPLSVNDPAYHEQGLDINPAIFLQVGLTDGTSQTNEYLQYSAENIVFDDVTGDPDDLIRVVYWNVDPDDPEQGTYGGQLTSTGKGVGTAKLLVSFRNAPHVTASVDVTVVSAVPQIAVPVTALLALQSYVLPINRRDQAYTISNLLLTPAIYVTTEFADRSVVENEYHKDFFDNVIIDDVSGDPNDLIEVVQWPVDNNNTNGPKFAGQITSTGRGEGTANLLLSFKNAPGVTASVAVTVVSGRQ